MDIFNSCHKINDLIHEKKESEARNQLIKLLDYHLKNEIEYAPVLNHLIRVIGLYPYLDLKTATWEDRLIYDLFKVEAGLNKPVTLHREQSFLLKRLLEGENIAVSAPTSFGKSFVIDAFISIAKPNNIVIIVPTIALTDETRRRIFSKFGHIYKIVTTVDVNLSDKNIFIFPQERAVNYINKISEIDILIVDEFYKASIDFDKERAVVLLKAILKFGSIAKQKYFLAPNISSIKDNIFTEDMEFYHLNFNTVFLEKYDLYKKIGKDESKKNDALIDILSSKKTKTLIYAGSYSQIDKVSNLLIEKNQSINEKLLNDFSEWLSINYFKDWKLTKLVENGTGVHNGRLHRSLSQIQVKLFEEEKGLQNIVSTSSIIEGVNTSAENVVIWRNKNGSSNLNDFTYKNIIGRGGRMFKHFIGKIYLLEEPPSSENTQLDIKFPDALLADFEEKDFERKLTDQQVAIIVKYKERMEKLLGTGTYKRLEKSNLFKSNNPELIIEIATELMNNTGSWNGLNFLNSEDTSKWDNLLYKIIKLQKSNWGIQFNKFVTFIKVISQNWDKSIPILLQELESEEIDIEKFFQLERKVCFDFASLVNDVNILQKVIFKKDNIDISSFAAKVSYAFLPPIVYQLEEYGLPRMISKKIQRNGQIDFLSEDLDIHSAISLFNSIGKDSLIEGIPDLSDFEIYILDYFYEGITYSPRL